VKMGNMWEPGQNIWHCGSSRLTLIMLFTCICHPEDIVTTSCIGQPGVFDCVGFLMVLEVYVIHFK